MCFLNSFIPIFVEGYLNSSNLWYITARIPGSFSNFFKLFSSADVSDINKRIMISLIVDATKDVIFLQIIKDNKSYTNEYSNSRDNFDRIGLIIFDYLKSNNIKLAEITNIFVNCGPGNFSGIRSSIVTCKAISISNSIKLYGFDSSQINDKKYNKVLDLLKKDVLIKDLIKPLYK